MRRFDAGVGWMHLLVFYLPMLFGALLGIGAAFGLIDTSVDFDADVDADVDADADGDGHDAGSASILGALGVGRAPLGVLLMSACFLFGLVGIALDAIGAGLALSIGGAALGAVGGTSIVARVFGRLVPTKETYVSRKTDLLGRAGTADVSTDARFGVAHVLDDGGAHIQIRCRALDEEPIERGEPIVVAAYDEETDTFLVTKMPS